METKSSPEKFSIYNGISIVSTIQWLFQHRNSNEHNDEVVKKAISGISIVYIMVKVVVNIEITNFLSLCGNHYLTS